jgi:hypothetical protein
MGFEDLFRLTESKKELLESEASTIPAYIAVACGLIYCSTNPDMFTPISRFNSPVKELLNIGIAGEFALLGFLIGGLALTIGSIDDDMLKFADEKCVAKPLVSLVFRFYFVGMCITLSIVWYILMYILMLMPLNLSNMVIYILIIINIYVLLTTLFMSVNLMGTNINLMILRRAWKQ